MKKILQNVYKITLYTVFFFLFFQLTYMIAFKPKQYGCIVTQENNSIKDAVVEKVVLYAKKNDHSDQKIMRRGILVKRENAKGTILFCHGFSCDKNDTGFLRYIFPDYNCMNFDFRAHGENREGQFCTLGKYEAYDVIAAAKFLRNHPDLQDLPVLAYGFSMGAVASIEAQAKEASLFDAMILDCPFDTSEKVIKRGLDNTKISIFGYEFHVPCRSILRKYVFHPYIQSFVKAFLTVVTGYGSKGINTFICKFHPEETVKKVSIPCLFILCKKDEKVSIEGIKSVYYNAASKYKKLWLTNGRRHFDSFFYNPEKYAERLKKFADKVVDGSIYKKEKHKIIEDIASNVINMAINVGLIKKGEE